LNAAKDRWTRVLRLLTKHVSAEDQALEQWFLVAIGDDDKATNAVAKSANAANASIEVVGHIPAATLASWGMTEGEVRLVLPRATARPMPTLSVVGGRFESK
jgi:hypothetical protein